MLMKTLITILFCFAKYNYKIFKFNHTFLKGEYGVILNKFYPCESTKNHLMKLNGIFSRKSTNIFEYKGDIFLKVPLDNTLDVSILCIYN